MMRFGEPLPEAVWKPFERNAFAAVVAVLGALTVVVWLAPAVATMGLYLGVLPGVLLLIAPTLFLYLAAGWAIAAGALALLRAAGVRPQRFARFAIVSAALAIPLGLGFLAPSLLNPEVDVVRAELTSGDIAHSGPISVPDVVGVTGRGSDDACASLCQRLLYNGAAKRVIVSRTAPSGGGSPVAYEIRRERSCPSSDLKMLGLTDVAYPADAGVALRSRIRERMEAGDCLTPTTGSLGDATLIVDVRPIVQRRLSITRAAPKDTVEADRIEISDGSGRVLFRKTEVRAAPLSTPLRISAGSAYRSAPGYFGFARSRTVSGEIGPEGRDVLPTLLGDAVRMPEPPNDATSPEQRP